MSKLLIAIASLALASPLAAQEQVPEASDDNYNMVIVYGDDECPQSTADQIVVCARKAESERYRIPENLRFSDSPDNKAWAERVESFEMAGLPHGLGGAFCLRGVGLSRPTSLRCEPMPLALSRCLGCVVLPFPDGF